MTPSSSSTPPSAAMEPRRLDAMIAEKVFGWTWLYRFGQKWFGPSSMIGETDPIYGTVKRWDEGYSDAVEEDGWWLRDKARVPDCPVVPHYSTDIAAAFLVVEKLRADGLRPVLMPDWNESWQCVVYRRAEFIAQSPFLRSLPHAICLAALSAGVDADGAET